MHNKKVLSEAVAKLGKKKTSKPYSKDIIKDPAGQWKYPGENTRIPSNNITMKDVNYPVWAQPNIGQGVMMYPGEDYHFPNAEYVDEYPQLSKGGIPDLPLKTNRKAFKDWTYSFERKQQGGDISIPELTKAQKGKAVKRKPLIISDPQEFAYRDRAYKDSLDMYHYSLDADKYFKAANNASSPAEMSKNMKLEAKATNAMINLKKNSPAKFGSVYAKQKAPVQPVQLAVKEKTISTKTAPSTTLKTKEPVKQKEKLNVQKPVAAIKQEPVVQEEIGTLPLRGINTESTLNPQIIPDYYLPPTQPVLSKGVWSDGSKGAMPKGMNTEEFKRKNQEYRNSLLNKKEPIANVFQEGGSIELELTPEEIENYKKLGYSVDYLD